MLFDPEKLTAIYWYCAILGTIVFILKTALPIDSGTEIHADFNSVVDSDSSFGLFTIESVAAFFMCGGWMGWFSFGHLHYELKITMLIALVSGACGMVFFAWLIAQFRKLEHNPKPSISELSGKTGKAYMRFAPKGTGKIQIEFNSKLEILEAQNDTDCTIEAFEPIKVVKIDNGNIYISKEN
ncbi:MAG: hypothetical protein LUE64_04865 [Candidatus Gastranaerophilales bacterium]|nr:hypothetical protein [Candidatus Gastranaerophilales bacterium]